MQFGLVFDNVLGIETGLRFWNFFVNKSIFQYICYMLKMLKAIYSTDLLRVTWTDTSLFFLFFSFEFFQVYFNSTRAKKPAFHTCYRAQYVYLSRMYFRFKSKQIFFHSIYPSTNTLKWNLGLASKIGTFLGPSKEPIGTKSQIWDLIASTAFSPKKLVEILFGKNFTQMCLKWCLKYKTWHLLSASVFTSAHAHSMWIFNMHICICLCYFPTQ